MSGKKRFQKPGSLQPNIDDILEWSKLPEMHLIRQAHRKKQILSKIARSVSYWQMHGDVFVKTRLRWLHW